MLTLNHNYYQILLNNKNAKEVNHSFKTRRFIFGLFILLLVDVLWVASSELTKYIYMEKKLERPFLITYVRSSLLLIYLLALCFVPPTRDPCRSTPDYTQLLEQNAEREEENYYSEATESLGDSTFIPVRAGETTDSDDAAPRAVRFNKVAEVRVMSASQAGEALLARLSWAASVRATEYAQRRAAAAATRRHVKLALIFCIPWFASNYLYRLSLVNAPTSSATVYCSTSGAFALSLGAIFAQTPTDRFSLTKCVAVLLTAAGLVAIGTSEIHQNSWTSVLSALGSALCYSVHLLLLRRELRRSEGINAPLLAGLVGCACAGVTWAIGGALGATGLEPAELPTSRLWSWLFLDAALGPLLAEAFWLWGRSLTCSSTATASLAFAAPLALCIEAWLGNSGGSASRWAGTALAAAGWLAAAACDTDESYIHSILKWLRMQCSRGNGFSSLRHIPELDEQSEALMSTDEPT